jgi:hypothetical protein
MTARRSGVLLLVAAAAFAVLSLRPSPWLAALAVTAGAPSPLASVPS